MNFSAYKQQRIELDESNIVIVPFSVVFNDATEFRMALNVHKVIKVIDLEDYNPLPEKYLPFFGLVKVDDIPVPIINLKDTLQGGSQEKLTNKAQKYQGRVIICHFQDVYVGVLVEKTRKLEHHSNEVVLPPPKVLHRGNATMINAVVNSPSGYLYMLDIETILDHYGIELNPEDPSTQHPDILIGKRILVVEDSRVFQKRCLQVFQKHGAQVDIADNGKSGLDLLEKNDYSYDLIFTDIEMPIMNGIDMANIIRERAPNLPIIFNSAISNQALVRDIKERNLGDYLIKFDEQTILKSLSTILNR